MGQASDRPIYLDHHSTTPVDPRVASVMVEAMTTAFGNPNSVEHRYGEEAATLVADARLHVADLLSAQPDGVHFTTGATEAISLALRDAEESRAHAARPLRVAATTVEHRAMMNALRHAEARGAISLRWIGVDSAGQLDIDEVREACAWGAELFCVMAANNEVGTIYPVELVCREAQRWGARVLIDATQATGRIPLSVSNWGIDYLALSAHKMYGPKGVGALVMGSAERLPGRSPNGTSAGTPPVPGIVGLGEACRLRHLEMADDEPRIATLRDLLQDRLCDEVPGLVVNGDTANRLAGNLHVSVPDLPGDAVVARLWRTVALSTGAACSSGAQESSHVLRAMGLSETRQEGALRMGLGKFTSEADVLSSASAIVRAVSAARTIVSAATV